MICHCWVWKFACQSANFDADYIFFLLNNSYTHKAIPNKLLDSHPIFENNLGGWFFFFFFFFYPVTGRLEIDRLFGISIFAIAE